MKTLRHARLLGGGLLCTLVGVLLVLPGVASAGTACGNEARRVEQGSTALPDCRAYELVTPPDKDSGEPEAVVAGLEEPNLLGIQGGQASEVGDRMAWTSEYALPGSVSPGVSYLSSRGAGGWSSENVIPQQSVENGTNCSILTGMAAYSSDLSKGILADGFGQPGSFKGEGLNCGHDEPRLTPVKTQLVSGELEGFQNLFLRDNDARSYQLVDVTPLGAPAPNPPLPPTGLRQFFPASFLAGSNDLSHVVFEEELQLTPEAPVGDDLYEWAGGADHLVTILPDATPVLGTLASATKNAEADEYIPGPENEKIMPFNIANSRHAVSGDGSRVFFEADGDLYVRENPEQSQSPLGTHGECTVPADACTVQVDASQASGPGGGGKFMVASENGSKVFFTDDDSAGLTSTTAVGSGQNLYEYDLESGVLSDLTPTAEVKVDGVSGASADGSYVYFVAEGVLASNTTAKHSAIAGQPNLYVFHEGASTFIATLDGMAYDQQYGDSCDWMSHECGAYPLDGGLTARVSANGAFIGFDSVNPLTGYDNVGPSCVPKLASGTSGVGGYGPGSCEEIFLYNADTSSLSCASCDPSGAAPAGPAMIRFPAKSTSNEMRNTYPQRNVSDSGQVFFDTPDALAPGDTNGKRDVYEYEDGRRSLISSGTSEVDSYFLDASVNGSDVFFVTAQQLLPRDDDTAYDIYDARTGGGFPEPALPGPLCEGEGCGGEAGAAPVFSEPSTATFVGAGNLVPNVAIKSVAKSKAKLKTKPCKKSYVRKRGHCVKEKAGKSGRHPKKGRK
jgi:hypothetical protein